MPYMDGMGLPQNVFVRPNHPIAGTGYLGRSVSGELRWSFPGFCSPKFP